MIYVIAIISGLILGFILSPNASDVRRGRNYDLTTVLTSVAGALLGVLFFINFLGIRMTVGFLWLEAILWSLLGALIIRLIVGAFTYDTYEGDTYDEPTRDLERPGVAAHEYRKTRVTRRRRRG